MICKLQIFPLFIWTIILSYSESSVILFRDEHSQLKIMQQSNVLQNEVQNQNIHFPEEMGRQEREAVHLVTNNNNPIAEELSRTFKIDGNFEGTEVPSRKVAKGLAFEIGDEDLSIVSENPINQCNEKFGDKKYRYNEITQQCYVIGTKGPCGQNMIFYESLENEINGYCDCITHESRIFIYHKRTQQCYPIFSQGYCQKGKWLILNSVGKPECKINPCYASAAAETHQNQPNNNNNKELILFNSRCVEMNTNQPECTRNEVVTFVPYQIQPDCTILQPNREFAIAALRQPCRPGTLRSVTGKCKKGWSW